MVTSACVNEGDTSQRSEADGVEKFGSFGHWMVCGPPTPVISGGVLSSTVMVCDAVELLPQASVAVHVLVTLYSCGQDPGVVTSACVNEGVTAQMSEADGVEKLGSFGHWMVCGPPTPVITGAVLSSTVMICDAVELLPQASVAVHVLVTLYSCGQEPGVVTSACVRVGLAVQLSDAVGEEKIGTFGQTIV